MELALRSGATAGVALLAASLVAVAPLARPVLEELQQRALALDASAAFVDPLSNLSDLAYGLQTVFDEGIDGIGYGFNEVVDGEVLAGLQDAVIGVDNIVIVAPETLFNGVVSTLVGQDFDHTWFYWEPGPLATSLPDLIDIVQSRIQSGQDLISEGLGLLGQGVVPEGLREVTAGVDFFIIAAPNDFAFGAANVLWESLLAAL